MSSIAREKHPVAQAVDQHDAVLHRLVSVGMVKEWGEFPIQELPQPLTLSHAQYAGRLLTHVHTVAYALGGDILTEPHYRRRLPPDPDKEIEATPVISFKLLQNSQDTLGVIAGVSYEPFSFLQGELIGHTLPDFSDRLNRPRYFSLESGDHFSTAHNEVYEDSNIGGRRDSGPLATFTAQAISLSSLVFAEYSANQLMEMASYSN